MIRPGSIGEVSAALRDTTGTVAIRGSGSQPRWGRTGEPPDVVLDLSGLTTVVEHAAGDLVVTAQAGVPLARLQAEVGGPGQWLALDPPEGGTIGGILASAASGPRRLRFGTPRDLLLGLTVVLADGTVARSGGKVVKNVAGYDLGKLFTGSFGTLGVIAQATLRLHPVLVARRVVTVDVDRPGASTRQVLRSPATPTAIEWSHDGRDGSGRLHVLIESSEAAVDHQAEQVASLIGGSVGAELPADFGQRVRSPGQMLLKVTFRLSALDAAITAVRQVLPAARLSAHAGSGVVWVTAEPDVTAVTSLRATISSYDGTVVAAQLPAGLERQLDPWGPVRGLDVMRRVKEQFDPQHRMNPGRFVGGI